MAAQQLQKRRAWTSATHLSGAAGLAALLLATWLVAVVGPAWAAQQAAPSEMQVGSSDSVITIGVAAALTPPIDFGWLQVNAVQLVVSETNRLGGLNIGGTTYSVTTVVADSACAGSTAISASQTLLEAGAVAVIGPTCSSAALAAQPSFGAAGVPMVLASASNVLITEQGYSTTFRVIPRDDAPAKEMARYFRESLDLAAVATVDWLGFGWSSRAFSETFAQLGGSIVGHETLSSTDEVTATLNAIQLTGAEAVFYADFDAARAGQFSAVADKVGLATVGWHVGDVPAMPDTYQLSAGSAAEGDFAARFGRDTSRMPGYQAFRTAYRAADFPNYGAEPSYVGAAAYDAARIILAALTESGSTDTAALRDQIAAMADHQGVVGTYRRFDAQGDVVPQWAWVVAYQNGGWVLALPYRVTLPLVLK